MYGIFTNIFPKNHPNVGKYNIHGAYGIDQQPFSDSSDLAAIHRVSKFTGHVGHDNKASAYSPRKALPRRGRFESPSDWPNLLMILIVSFIAFAILFG